MITKKSIYELELDLGNSALFIGAFDEQELRDRIFPQFMEIMRAVIPDIGDQVPAVGETSMSLPAATESLRNEIAAWNYDLDDHEIVFRGKGLNGSFSDKDILDAYAETHKEPPEPVIPKPERKTYKATVTKEPEKDIMPTEPKPKRGRTPKEKHPSGVDLEYVEHIKSCLERTSDFKSAANRMSGLLHLSPATCGKYMAMYKDWEAQNQNAE